MKKIAKLVFPLCLLLCFLWAAPRAYAEEEEIDFQNKSWDEIVEEFLGGYNVTEGQVTIGYYNTVTGEEHFYDPDRYMKTGSMYKVPLTMVFAEKLEAGEITLEDTAGGYRYDTLLKGAIVDSNNDYAAVLWKKLGSYHEYRRIIAPIMGEDPDDVDEKYYENNFFTARQMLTCLKKLYEGRETYGIIIDLMKQAEPSEYFRRHEDRYEVAHKYGYLADDARGIIHLNDCGIIYTGDPYLLVCFTEGAEKPYGIVSNLCTLMSDYTQFHYEERLQAEAEAKAEEQRRETEEALRAAREQGLIAQDPNTAAAPSNSPGAGSEPEPEQKEPVSRAVILIVLFAVCALLTVWAEIRSQHFDLKRLLLGLVCILACIWFWFSAASGG